MKPQGIIWIGISVEDLAAQVVWYRDILGLNLRRQGDGWAHFDAGGGAILELMSGGQASRETKGADRQSIVFGLQVTDLDQAMVEMRARGVVFPDEPEQFKNQRWAYFSDPEGNRLEIKEIHS